MKIKPNLLWEFLLAIMLLAACSPAAAPASGDGIVRAILFYTPGCSSCEQTLRDLVPSLETEFGARLVITRVPLNSLTEVNLLFDSADFFKMKKDDMNVPLVIIGRDVLVGEDAVRRDLHSKIQSGLAAGGLKTPQLPANLADLAARPTPTPRATLAPVIEVPGVGAAKATTTIPAPCVINTPCPTPGK